MKRHLVTAAILLLALVLYMLGLSGLGAGALVVGAVFELWFWIRVFGRRSTATRAGDAGAPG